MNTEEDRKLQWWPVAALNLFFVGGNNNLNGTKLPSSFFQKEELDYHCCTWCVCVCVYAQLQIHVRANKVSAPSVWCTGSLTDPHWVTLSCEQVMWLFVPRSWSLWDFYLIVSSLPLSCWNLLWRFLICSSETEKREQKPTARRKVCHWHTPTTMIIIFKPHPRDYNCPSVVITGGVSRPCTEPGRKSTCLCFLSQLFWTLGLQVWFYSTFVLTGSAAVATAFVPGSLPLWVPFEEVFQSLTQWVNNNDKKIWRAHAAPTQQVCLCKHLCDCAHVAVEAADSSKKQSVRKVAGFLGWWLYLHFP